MINMFQERRLSFSSCSSVSSVDTIGQSWRDWNWAKLTQLGKVDEIGQSWRNWKIDKFGQSWHNCQVDKIGHDWHCVGKNWDPSGKVNVSKVKKIYSKVIKQLKEEKTRCLKVGIDFLKYILSSIWFVWLKCTFVVQSLSRIKFIDALRAGLLTKFWWRCIFARRRSRRRTRKRRRRRLNMFKKENVIIHFLASKSLNWQPR